MHNRQYSRISHLLAVGPLPPPLSGANVSFQLFCEHLTAFTHIETLTIIDTSPKRIKDDISILTISNLRLALRTLTRFWREAKSVDSTIIFGSNQFLLSLTPLLVLLARLRGKPCFIRSFGGSLDQYAESIHPLLRRILLGGFELSDGLLVETMLLYRYFAPLLNDKAYLMTAYRSLKNFDSCKEIPDRADSDSTRLTLVFISWVRVEKGVRALLEALQSLSPDEQARIQCDIYGPLVDSYAAEFEVELPKTPSAKYRGELDNTYVMDTMQQYDVLVFPTFYQGEGYPGVIVEAMTAGLPVITTRFRSIPDMIDDRVNGLLVPPQDPVALSEAIRFALHHPEKLRSMGKENQKRQNEYDLGTVLPQLVEIMEQNILDSPTI